MVHTYSADRDACTYLDQSFVMMYAPIFSSCSWFAAFFLVSHDCLDGSAAQQAFDVCSAAEHPGFVFAPFFSFFSYVFA